MIFPITAGDFRRVAIQSIDGVGREVVAEYVLIHPQGTVSVKVSIYPAVAEPVAGGPPGTVSADGAVLANRDFEKRKLAVLNTQSGGRLLRESSVAGTTWGQIRLGKIATYEHEDMSAGQRLRSELWVYPFLSGR